MVLSTKTQLISFPTQTPILKGHKIVFILTKSLPVAISISCADFHVQNQLKSNLVQAKQFSILKYKQRPQREYWG